MIMLSESTKNKLKAHWGDKADALDCMAELRVYDPLSAWQVYIYAMNPDDENEISILVSVNAGIPPFLTNATMHEINTLFNKDGEKFKIDVEYRPRNVGILFKSLNQGFE